MRKWMKALAAAVLGISTCWGAETPILNLRLDGNANGASANFTNLQSVSAQTVVAYTTRVSVVQLVSGVTTSYLNQTDVASMQGTLPESEMKMLFSKDPTNGAPDSAVAPSGWLKSTTLGSEGFRRIGALGGYTLEEFVEDTSARGASRDLPVFSWVPSSRFVTWAGGDIYDPFFKNGVQIGWPILKRANNAADDLVATWSFVDITTSVNDAYEVYFRAATATDPMTTAGVNNWWSGFVVQ